MVKNPKIPKNLKKFQKFPFLIIGDHSTSLKVIVHSFTMSILKEQVLNAHHYFCSLERKYNQNKKYNQLKRLHLRAGMASPAADWLHPSGDSLHPPGDRLHPPAHWIHLHANEASPLTDEASRLAGEASLLADKARLLAN